MHHTGTSWREAMTAVLEKSGQKRLIRAHEVADVVLDFCLETSKARNGEIAVIDGADTP
jgi:hypothetical protein